MVRRYILQRLLHLLVILFGATFLSFALMHTVSTDTVDVLYTLNGNANAAVAAAKRASLGLDRTFLVQYGDWLWRILHGDMGNSFVSGEPVLTTILQKLPATMELMVLALLMTILAALPLGILAALHRDRFWDQAVRIFSFLGNAMPDFFTALLLLYLFAVHWHLFSFLDASRLPVLPALTLSIAMTAKSIRQVRAVFLDELSKTYVQAALVRGLPVNTVLLHYVLRSVLAPLLALLGVSAGSLLGGAAIVESIFLWDGIGKLAVDAILLRDYPVIQAYVIWMCVIYVGVNLLMDLLSAFLDPRVAERGSDQ